MRAAVGLVGLLIAIGVIVWVMGKSTLPYTQEVLKKGETARQDVNQIAGNARDGSMSFAESVVLEPETKAGKINAITVTKVTPGGPAETFFGLKEEDAIVEIGPLAVKEHVNSDDDAKAFMVDAYQKQQQITVIRDGNRITLPQAKPKPAAAANKPANNSGSGDPLQQQLDSIQSTPGLR